MDFFDFIFGLSKEILLTFFVIFLLMFSLSFCILKYRGKVALLCGILILLSGGGMYYLFKISFISILLPYIVVPAILLGFIVGVGKYEKPAEPLRDVEIKTNRGIKIVRNVFAGIGIFGASRSGKTASVIYQFILHFFKWDFAGLVYDYKNGELTEICTPLFGDRVKVFAVHRPNISVRINPINPKYLKDEKEVNSIVAVLLDNLNTENKGNGGFFYETAESLLSALVLKFSIYHKHYCTIPHIIAFILSVDFSLKEEESKGLKEDTYATFLGLKKFLTDDNRVRIQASSFILGLASEKQTAGVISTLANALRKISFPESFWALTGNDIDLDINSDENRVVLSILNEPRNEQVLTPFLAMITHCITRQMMVRNRKPAFILLDEAPTMKLKNMARIVATMASFNIASLYCAQDISQAVKLYTKDGFKEILANLSTLFFGKANDPDTGKFYEQYFEPKMIKTKSKSSGRGGSSTTIGEREVAKIRSHEFATFTTGKFAFLSGGKAELVNFPKFDIKSTPLLEEENFNREMIDYYTNIIDKMNDFAKEIGVSEI